MKAIIDIEANGLLDTVSKMWCIVVRPVENPDDFYVYVPDEHVNDELYKYTDVDSEGRKSNFLIKPSLYIGTSDIRPLSQFEDEVENISEHIGHNYINYDSRAIKKVMGIDVPLKNITDTLLLSQITRPVRQGGHSLKAWGIRFDNHKGDYKQGFDEFNWDMVAYCVQDTSVTLELYNDLQPTLDKFSKGSVRLEHYMRKALDQMQENGFKLDVKRATLLHAEIQDKVMEIEAQIKEDFPPVKKYLNVRQIRRTKEGVINKVSQRFLDTGFWVDYDDAPQNFKDEIDTLVEASKPPLFNDPLPWEDTFDEEPSEELTRDDFKVAWEWEEFNLGSPKQVVERMYDAGWNPVVFKKPSATQKAKGMKSGSPQLCEENFDTLYEEAPQSARNIATWLTLNSRLKVLQQWFEAVDPDTDLIHGRVQSIGAGTHRMSHQAPNMANNPKVSTDKDGNIIYGYEVKYASDFRACWIPRKDNRKIVGIDLSGIQLRGFAHYTNDKKYINQILDGDIHAYNLEILQNIIDRVAKKLGIEAPILTRNNAKTFIYGFMFGAGAEKTGAICKFPAEHQMEAGVFIKNGFVKSIGGLAKFKKEMKVAAQHQYMYGLDGRLIEVPSEHLALSIYLQSFEAIIMKYVIFLATKRIREENLDALLVAVVHDETQWDVLDTHAERLGQLVVECMEEAGRYFNCNIPITGEYKVGDSWASSH